MDKWGREVNKCFQIINIEVHHFKNVVSKMPTGFSPTRIPHKTTHAYLNEIDEQIFKLCV